MAKAKAAKASKYKPHPGLAKEAADKERLRAATGRSFEEWVEFARKKGPKEQRACRAWLQSEHGHGSRNAWWLASSAVTPDGEASYSSPEGFVDALYCGDKAALRPVHEAIVDAAIALGDDVVPTSCKTMVPIYRKHVFAEMRPVDGVVEAQLALGDVPAKGRLLAADGRQPGDRLTHRVRLRCVADVDAEFKGWLRAAYANGAGDLVVTPLPSSSLRIGREVRRDDPARQAIQRHHLAS